MTDFKRTLAFQTHTQYPARAGYTAPHRLVTTSFDDHVKVANGLTGSKTSVVLNELTERSERVDANGGSVEASQKF